MCSGRFSYAWPRASSGTKSCRGTRLKAPSTWASKLSSARSTSISRARWVEYVRSKSSAKIVHRLRGSVPGPRLLSSTRAPFVRAPASLPGAGLAVGRRAVDNRPNAPLAVALEVVPELGENRDRTKGRFAVAPHLQPLVVLVHRALVELSEAHRPELPP